MSVTGVNGATPNELPKSSETTVQTEQTQANSVWAQFNDNGNNKVDLDDVQYTTNKKDDFITAFLKRNINKDWTDSLKAELQKKLDAFNKFCAGQSTLDNAQANYDKEQQQMQNAYNSAKAQNEEDFDTTKAQNEQEMAEFTEDANGMVMNFTSQAVKEQGTFVKESVNKILDSLKNGASGGVVLQGLGTITYDNEKQAIVFNQTGKSEPRVLDNGTLEKLLDFALQKNIAISGNSKKITSE